MSLRNLLFRECRCLPTAATGQAPATDAYMDTPTSIGAAFEEQHLQSAGYEVLKRA